MAHDMGSSQAWRSSLPNLHLDQAGQPQPFTYPSNISSYFRRPSKIVKPSSRGNSPMNLTRRRTTASHTTTKRQSMWKGSISSYGIPGLDGNYAAAIARPISWHPNSMTPMHSNEGTLQSQYPDSGYSAHILARPFTTTEVHGLITPLTQPSSAESCYNEIFTPLDEMHNLDNAYSFSKQPGNNNFWPPQSNLVQQFSAQQTLAHPDPYTPHQRTSFAYPSGPDIYTGTAPPTPELLPNSNLSATGGNSPGGLQSDDEVLVGMGLYDTPSPPNTAGLHSSQIGLPHRRSAGKGLKLEETFEPSTEDGSDGDDDNSEEAANDNADLQQLVSEPAPASIQSHDAGVHPCPTSLANQSFFFDNDNDDDDDKIQDLMLQQTYNHHFNGPIWTDVYSNAPFNWV